MSDSQTLRGGLDLGGTKIQAAILDPDNAVLGQARRPTPTSGGPPAVADALAEALQEAAKDAGVEAESLAGVGVGSPGSIDAKAGTVANARNLDSWTDPFPLASKLAERLGGSVRVALGNDVAVATEAEVKLGAGKGYGSLLGVFWGTGVGGAVVFDGVEWKGRGAAGEIGHMVIKRGGRRCTCGRRGCMEAYAGRKAMELEARRRMRKGTHTKLFEIMEEQQHDRLTSGIWERALKHGDELAERLIRRAIRALGAGVASAVNLLDVEAVVIGGGLGVRFGQDGVDRIRTAMLPHLFNDDRPPDLVVAALGDLGGATGAALLVADG